MDSREVLEAIEILKKARKALRKGDLKTAAKELNWAIEFLKIEGGF